MDSVGESSQYTPFQDNECFKVDSWLHSKAGNDPCPLASQKAIFLATGIASLRREEATFGVSNGQFPRTASFSAETSKTQVAYMGY